MTSRATCDYCHRSGVDVEKRRIVVPAVNRQTTFLACPACLMTVPLAGWEALMPHTPKGSRPRRVLTVAEVEALARTDRKA